MGNQWVTFNLVMAAPNEAIDLRNDAIEMYCPIKRTDFLTTLLTTNICRIMLFFACFCFQILPLKIEKSLENTVVSVLSRLSVLWRRVRDSNTYLPVGITRSAVF